MQEPTHDRIAETARALGLDLPEACRPGVLANLDLLAQHAKVLDDYLAGDDA
ncbi:hypothetical protein ABAC460_06695 [Asticcacaulis sp. AC460]|uniref:DUF4089 domain-containing protein n=1 Tax=Asticcacaulis sp. AC460 TaxID=1282360 RepID=UPI0003C3EAB2|nr:DUF4089 domain-containing protein [Asticcacaulis sp. AC460]ESQ91247.1 hypothetical protein ABAC460_06695 [Asticcacaulis sp. AC460]